MFASIVISGAEGEFTQNFPRKWREQNTLIFVNHLMFIVTLLNYVAFCKKKPSEKQMSVEAGGMVT